MFAEMINNTRGFF